MPSKTSQPPISNGRPPLPTGGSGTTASPFSPQPDIETRLRAAELALNDQQAAVANAYAVRARLITDLMDPRRDIEEECGYPKVVTVQMLHKLHRRNAFARRVNEVMAKEAFQVTLRVWENDDKEDGPKKPQPAGGSGPTDEEEDGATPFERGVDDLGSQARGVRSWHRDEKGSYVHTTLMRAAVAAGIGHYGVILVGLDDGLPMSEPAAGVEERYSMPGRYDGTEKALPAGWKDPYTGNARTRVVTTNGLEPEGAYSLRIDERRTRCVMTTNLAADGSRKVAEAEKPAGERRELTYLRVLPEALAMVTRWEMNRGSPRYGQPVSYLISTQDWYDSSGSFLGAPSSSLDVHWTRVVHVPGQDLHPDECTSTPECEPVINHLCNLDKIFGSSGEGCWKSGFNTLVFETHPSLGPNPKVDKAAVRDQMENYDNSLTKSLAASGGAFKTLGPSVMDLTPHVAANVEAICVKKAIPKRIFMGSERGELSSTQDEGDWNDKLSAYQRTYLVPYVVVPFYDRMIMLGVLPEPEQYHAEFEDVSAQSDQEIASVALAKTQALAAAIQGNVFSVVAEEDWLTDFTRFMEADEAQAVLERAVQAEQDKYDEDQQFADEQGMVPTPPDGFQHPEPPPQDPVLDPIKLKQGERLVPHPASGATAGGAS